jgi:hypothetical protein
VCSLNSRAPAYPSYTSGVVLREGNRLIVATSTHDGTADLAWLVQALDYARAKGQTRVVGYLEAVLDDVVFEMESASPRG